MIDGHQTAQDPAHAQLVDRVFNQRQSWQRIDQRLRQYPAIATHFPSNRLREWHGRPPYYVHYMAWRLGTWGPGSDPGFEVLDDLLRHAASLSGWTGEASLLASADFGQFWSLVWQVQVAAFLSRECSAVSWLGGSGPDLCAEIDGTVLHVECYSVQKRFGTINFVEDLCREIDPGIKVNRSLCLPVSFADRRPEVFLDRLFQPFVAPGFLAEMRGRTQRDGLVELPLPTGTTNLRLIMEGEDAATSNDDQFLANQARQVEANTVGDPETYLEVVLGEAINAKAGKNRLANYSNNVVAINMLLSAEFRWSIERQRQLGRAVPDPRLPPDIHLATISTCPIDRRVADFQFGFTGNPSHPALNLFGLTKSPSVSDGQR